MDIHQPLNWFRQIFGLADAPTRPNASGLLPLFAGDFMDNTTLYKKILYGGWFNSRYEATL
jgi:hypothetical protein